MLKFFFPESACHPVYIHTEQSKKNIFIFSNIFKTKTSRSIETILEYSDMYLICCHEKQTYTIEIILNNIATTHFLMCETITHNAVTLATY